MASSSSSSSFFDIEPLDGGETCRHAMDACSLCGKRLAGDCDIFMYRGDTPFCSEECRCHRMVLDEASVKNSKPFKEHPAQKEQSHAADPGHVGLAANVPVAT
ncbi:FCS-Like Zinc finger 2-like [Phragmites australis]|uniref:FCS-Like Zinc finger 2-like n=1 Tax=Phragmites australis TaxID=29695 RepID=UPI002D76E9D6|nr:FCS-Like Zinc finger 2-like [Phragmites australis]